MEGLNAVHTANFYYMIPFSPYTVAYWSAAQSGIARDWRVVLMQHSMTMPHVTYASSIQSYLVQILMCTSHSQYPLFISPI